MKKKITISPLETEISKVMQRRDSFALKPYKFRFFGYLILKDSSHNQNENTKIVLYVELTKMVFYVELKRDKYC